MSMKALRSVLFALLLLAVGCSKNEGTHYPINAELKEAFNYKPGTYWIYRDSISGIIDSFCVTENIVTDESNSTEGSYEGIEVRIIEKNISHSQDSARTYHWVLSYTLDVINATFYFDGNSSPCEYKPFVNYPFKNDVHNFTGGGSSDKAHVNSIYDSYDVNGKSFNNVCEVNHKTMGTLTGYDDVFYLSPEAGIIKIKLNHPFDTLYRIWELQRLEIKK